MRTVLLFSLLLANPLTTVTVQQHDGHDMPAPEPRASVLPAEYTQQVYACPMHPHIQQHEPGNCPICGMTLVSRAVPLQP